ncbi:MAG: hypothetical protein RI573_14860 [Balneolaceae bacterium]|nr:hypothetical protein [Balneolaceae bacterium]
MKSGALKRGRNPRVGRLSKTDTPRRWVLERQEINRGVVRKIMNGFLIRLNRSWSFSMAFPSRSTALKRSFDDQGAWERVIPGLHLCNLTHPNGVT